jgi:peptidoglycan hydrolase CwlO-like protein
LALQGQLENANKGRLAKVTVDQAGFEFEIERLIGEIDDLQTTGEEKDNQISTQEMTIAKLTNNVRK